MLSQETLNDYRRMTTAERLALVLRMMRDASRYISEGPPDLVARRFELLRRENDERNRNMLTAIARTRDRHD